MNEFSRADRSILKKMAYPEDQQGILRRYFRERESWQEHLDNCRNFIIREVEKRNPVRMTVLGSGWLLDFPLEKIAVNGRKIELVDVCHPPQIKAKVKAIPGVSCLNADITGGLISYLYEWNRMSRKSVEKPRLDISGFNGTFPFEEKTFFVSLNVLNQLDILLVDYLCKFRDYDEAEIAEFRKLIQMNHIRMISRQEGIIITDYLERHHGKDGEILEEKSLLYTKLPGGIKEENWTWKFDSQGMYVEGMKVEFEVKAISF